MQELHGEKVISRVNQFKQLDQRRESLIEEAIILCKTGESFSVKQINEVTERINELARHGVIQLAKMLHKQWYVNL
ncbi:hypothetical protein CHI02_03230 [Niallia circulans]|uniref:DUF2533 family protein n=1 Tax=Niallia TaxID=2837506 RepID=UPI000BA53FD9|nr:DUF2533 family protein [Niallia circulans]MED5099551.1 DUF2533 family protein [Niallia circulans]PAD27672.1 hypothetical protein CHH62_01015 [Niallia circulans]PAE13674.1 hypothetical protein CHI02_03230 [Niallia circulans]